MSAIDTLPTELLAAVFELVTSSATRSDVFHDQAEHEHSQNERGHVGNENQGISEHGHEHDHAHKPQHAAFPHDFNVYSTLAPCAIFAPVCRRWRDVAFATPTLWTSILVTSHGAREREFRAQLEAVRRSLERSRSRPVNVLVDVRDPAWDFAEPDMSTPPSSPSPHLLPLALFRSALDLLLPHHARWRTLALLSDIALYPHDLLAHISPVPSLPALHALHIARCNELAVHLPSLANAEEGLPRLPRMPALRSLALCGMCVEWEALIEHALPVQGLEDLALEYLPRDARPSAQEFCALIAGSPGLRRLRLRSAGPAESPTHDPSSDLLGCGCPTPSSCSTSTSTSHSERHGRALPSVESLVLGYEHSSDALHAFAHVDLAHLVHLTLEEEALGTRTPYTPASHADVCDAGRVLRALLSKTVPPSASACAPNEVPMPMPGPSFPRLAMLDLHDLSATEAMLSRAFEHTPQLARLTLSGRAAEPALHALSLALRPQEPTCVHRGAFAGLDLVCDEWGRGPLPDVREVRLERVVRNADAPALKALRELKTRRAWIRTSVDEVRMRSAYSVGSEQESEEEEEDEGEDGADTPFGLDLDGELAPDPVVVRRNSAIELALLGIPPTEEGMALDIGFGAYGEVAIEKEIRPMRFPGTCAPDVVEADNRWH